MTPWLRSTLPCVRLLLVLATAVPAYGTVTAYAAPAYASEPGAIGPAAPAHPHGPAPAPAQPHRPPRHSKDTAREAPDPPVTDPRDSTGPTDSPSHDPGHDPGHGDSPGTGHSHAPMPTDSASASYRPGPSVEPSRAGSRAGEGRMRPGRPDGPAAEIEGDDDTLPTRDPGTGRPEEPETANLPAVTPTASTAPDQAGLDRPPDQNTTQQGQTTTAPVLQILPLGTGLVLIGLGLALAFLGLKLRRS
ncbi:hypothetical protein AB0L75_05930 [Streptomyces sp. NPDC052101]|uniref:hypothetical protein n=1 Tax=Streptomyces sp. NPDC052101 TaxID=3155763 RepID=UPI00342F9429